MLSVENDRSRLILADCLDALREMPDCSIDSIVTDPPYGLSFMGKLAPDNDYRPRIYP